MKRVLLVHRSLQPPGGGNAVGAWVLEALRGRYECDLLAWQPVELDDINVFFGTSLRPGDFNVHLMNQTLHRALDWLPPPLGLLRLSALFRTARHHLRRHDYDVLNQHGQRV